MKACFVCLCSVFDRRQTERGRQFSCQSRLGGPRERFQPCGTFVARVFYQSDHHMVPLLPTKTLRRCCPLLWRPSKKDTLKKKKKNPSSSVCIGSTVPLWRRFVWPIGNTNSGPVHSCHKMEHLQTEPAGWNISRWNGRERKVIGPPTSLCRSLKHHLAVTSYISIARFPTRWRFFFFSFTF